MSLTATPPVQSLASAHNGYQPRKLGQPRLLIVGCGDVGTRLLERMTSTHRVFALTSQPERCETLRAEGAIPLLGNLDNARSLQRLRGLSGQIVHLAPPPQTGQDDPRTAHLLTRLAHPGWRRSKSAILPDLGVRRRKTPARKRLVYGSTSGVYGDCGGAWVSESRPVRPQNDRAVRRVAAERHCHAWSVRGHCATVLRIPGIYALNRLPIARLQNGTPALSAEEDVFTNHIHADDLARICRAAIFRGRAQRTLHASDQSQMKMAEYFAAVAQWAGLPEPPRLSRAALAQVLSPVQMSFMQESRRLRTQRLQRELRLPLQFPTVHDFLQATPAPRLMPSQHSK